MSTDKYDALLELADQMSTLQEISDSEWHADSAGRLYREYKRFRDLSDAWTQINGVNYYLKAKFPSQ
jgi:hypothetical protein